MRAELQEASSPDISPVAWRSKTNTRALTRAIPKLIPRHGGRKMAFPPVHSHRHWAAHCGSKGSRWASASRHIDTASCGSRLVRQSSFAHWEQCSSSPGSRTTSPVRPEFRVGAIPSSVSLEYPNVGSVSLGHPIFNGNRVTHRFAILASSVNGFQSFRGAASAGDGRPYLARCHPSNQELRVPTA